MASTNMRLENLVLEMASTLKQKMGARHELWGKDTAVFVATDDGSIVAIDNEIHLGSASEMALSLVASQNVPIAEGDVVVSNDPYLGSAHVQDFYTVTPVYHRGRPMAFLAAKAHLPDCGGDVQGGFNPRADEIWAEGVRITPLKIYRDGRLDASAFNMILLNTRTPDALRLGLEAMLAAVESGKKTLQSVLQSSGEETLLKTFKAAASDTADGLRQTVRTWPAGEYVGTCLVRDERIKANALRVEVTLKIKGSAIEIDLSRNTAQLRQPYNSPRGNTLSFALMPFFPLLPSGTAANGGIWKVIQVKSNKGTVVDPVLPAPTAFSPFHVGREIATCVRSALDKCLSQEEKQRVDKRLPSLVSWHPQGD
jgi:N-methylhydantoinase B